jgi:hypothetical protein
MQLRALLGIAAVLVVAVGLVVTSIYRGLEAPAQTKLFAEFAKALTTFALTVVIGALISLAVQLHLSWKTRESALLELQRDAVRRLVGVANMLRKVPSAIHGAEIRAFTDSRGNALFTIHGAEIRAAARDQVPAVVDARLELHLLSHETDAFTDKRGNALFASWQSRAKHPESIKSAIGAMQAYLRDLETELRAGVRPEGRPSLLDDLLKPHADFVATVFYDRFMVPYRAALTSMQQDIAKRRRIL